MKNRSIVWALALSIGLFATSCSKDDNEGETLAPLSGKWNLSQIGTTLNGKEQLIDAPQNQSGCEKDYIYLKLDNTITDGDYDSSDSPCKLNISEGIYSRSHNNLTTVVNNVTRTQDIVNLSLKELKLKDSFGVITIYTR